MLPTIKGDGEVVGVIDDFSALRRWMVAGPEVSRFVAFYNATTEANDTTQTLDNRHHEQTEMSQRLLLDKVDSLLKVVKDIVNLFPKKLRCCLIEQVCH